MIKAEFLKNDWWYWSSFAVAVKTTTMSSLALKIYTLDDNIIYMKDPAPNTEPTDNAKPVNKAKRGRLNHQHRNNGGGSLLSFFFIGGAHCSDCRFYV